LQSELTKKESQWREEATIAAHRAGGSRGFHHGWEIPMAVRKAGKIIGKYGKTMEQHNK